MADCFLQVWAYDSGKVWGMSQNQAGFEEGGGPVLPKRGSYDMTESGEPDWGSPYTHLTPCASGNNTNTHVRHFKIPAICTVQSTAYKCLCVHHTPITSLPSWHFYIPGSALIEFRFISNVWAEKPNYLTLTRCKRKEVCMRLLF